MAQALTMDTMTNAEANRKYFDQIGASYDKAPWMAKVNDQVTSALRNRLDWIGIPWANQTTNVNPSTPKEVRLLDYACGSGLLSRALGPFVTQTQGIDISKTMVETFNQRAEEAKLSPTTISAVVGDLFTTPKDASLSEPQYFDFDIATSGFAFHHFADPVLSAERLKERLKPGGVVVITDFLEDGDVVVEGSRDWQKQHAHHHHHHLHTPDNQEPHHYSPPKDLDKTDPAQKVIEDMSPSIVRPAFTADGIKKIFEAGGLVDVDISIMEEKAWMEFGGTKLWRTIFFAKGRRPLDGENL